MDLSAQATNERIAVHDSFLSPFTARTLLWTVIRSFAGRMLYIVTPLLSWVLTLFGKRLAGTSTVQTFIYQFVVFNKINRLTLKRFEQKYLQLSGFTLEAVQISPANTLYSIHVW